MTVGMALTRTRVTDEALSDAAAGASPADHSVAALILAAAPTAWAGHAGVRDHVAGG